MQLRKTKRNLISGDHPLTGAMRPFVAHLALSCANFSSLTGLFLWGHGFANWVVIEFGSGICCEAALPVKRHHMMGQPMSVSQRI
jgi:hypothetical protein